MSSHEMVASRFRALGGAASRLRGLEVVESSDPRRTSVNKLASLPADRAYPDELLETLEHVAGGRIRWQSNENVERVGAIRIPDVKALARGMSSLPDSSFAFDSTRDASFAVVDFHTDDTMGFVVRARDGSHRYVVARAGREADGVAVARTFAEYLSIAIDRFGIGNWATPDVRLADGMSVAEHIEAARRAFAPSIERAEQVLTVECVQRGAPDLDAVRARLLRSWLPQQVRTVASALGTRPEELHRALIAPEHDAKAIVSALKKAKGVSPLPASAKALRELLLADASPDAFVELRLRITGFEDAFFSRYDLPLLVADAPGAESLREALGDVERLRFDSLARNPPVCPELTLEGAGSERAAFLTIPAELAPTGCHAGTVWRSICPS